MSNWIRVTNLPYYYDEEEAVSMFSDIGSIKRIHIEGVQLLLKSTAFIQFANAKKARLAAIKKDQIVFADAVIRVQVVWGRKETLTTLKVSNLPLDVTELSLLEYFSPFGEVVDIDFNKSIDVMNQENDEEHNGNSWCDEKLIDSTDKGKVAWVSFARVDYALRACQEMHHSIISSGGDNSRLCVKLANPDTRNVKWKRNLFEYVRCSVPSKRSRSKSTESGVSKSLTAPKTNGSVNEKMTRSHHQVNPSQCWYTSQVSVGNSGPHVVPSVYNGASTMNSRFDESNTSQTHNFLPQFSQGNANNTNSSPNVVLCDAYGQLIIPNGGFVTSGNFNPYLTVPHNANYVTSMSNCSNGLQSSSNGLAFSPQMISSSPNNGPFLTTQLNSHIDNRYVWSPSQMPTLPSVQTSGTNSVPSTTSNNTTGNQSASSSVANSGVKVIVTDSSNNSSNNLSNNSSFKKSSSSMSSSASIASSISSNNSNSSSIWSDKQREVGDIIYRELRSEFPSRVAKLTGMLLSLHKDELSRLLADSNKLKARAYQFCQLLDNK